MRMNEEESPRIRLTEMHAPAGIHALDALAATKSEMFANESEVLFSPGVGMQVVSGTQKIVEQLLGLLSRRSLLRTARSDDRATEDGRAHRLPEGGRSRLPTRRLRSDKVMFDDARSPSGADEGRGTRTTRL